MKKRVLKIIIFAIIIIIIVTALWITYRLRSSLPKTKGEISILGLSNEVEIIRDKLGIPHIVAENEEDLFFACGYVHTQDRLWQMELSRRIGAGTLSEIFGEKTLETDTHMRALGLRQAAEKDFKSLTPKMKKLLASYCAGVNYYLKKKKNLPPEFLILRYKPQPWKILDCFLIKQNMALTLSYTIKSKLLRMELFKRFGKDKAQEIIHSSPVGDVVIPSFDFEMKPLFPRGNYSGSNNWVADGTLTQTGKPLLANDPHLKINSLPSIWYGIHMRCPEINVIGVSLPGVPGVIIGHNDYIAWGITNSYVDIQDLYLEKLDPEQKKYFFNGDWKDLKIYKEEIVVKGEKNPKKIDVKWTHRGPILTPWIIQSERPISMRWAIYEGGQAAEAFYLIDKAKNWYDFVNGVSLFDSPSQNFVYADIDGNIGYYLNGKIPIRNNHKGLLPVPGETDEYDWKGFLKEEEKPFSFNSLEHLVVTANNKIVSDDYPYFLGDEYIAPFRAQRIKELLAKRKNHSIDSFKEIQLDIHSLRARLLLPFIKELENLSATAQKAQDILKNWDGNMSDDKEAVLFHIFIQMLEENTFKDELGDSFPQFQEATDNKWAGIYKIINNPQSSWFDNIHTPETELRKDIINMSLSQAYERLEEKFGSPKKWEWSKMHAIHFQHPLGQVWFLKFLNRGPYPIKGTKDTVNASFFLFDNPFRTEYGVSYRQIIDLDDMKNSVFVLPTGQSGHFLSRHYDDQIKTWLEGRYYPMLFDMETIEKESEGKLILKPIKENRDSENR